MTNDLKNFLEEETQLFENRYKDISTQIKSYGEYCDVRDFNTHSNKRIVNKVLDLVEKEVEKKKVFMDLVELMCDIVYPKDISNIIKQLRV